MAEVKWIKLMVDVFDNRKIRQIESMPDGDAIIVVWFYLLCLAGETNDGGAIYMTRDIPYTEEMLATFMRRPLNLVKVALHTFKNFGMIDVVDDILMISNWAKYQNVEGMDKIRAQTRARVARHRANKRLEAGEKSEENAIEIEETALNSAEEYKGGDENQVTEGNATCNVTVTQSNAYRIREKKEDIEKENKSVCGADAPPPDESLKKKKPIRKKYGQYGRVLLTDEEHARLLKDLGNEELSRCIQYIDESAQSTGNKNGWKDWNLVLRRCSKQKWGLGYNARAAPTKISANKEYEQEDWHGQQR
jgi:predicted phage replisome organizer